MLVVPNCAHPLMQIIPHGLASLVEALVVSFHKRVEVQEGVDESQGKGDHSQHDQVAADCLPEVGPHHPLGPEVVTGLPSCKIEWTHIL